MDSVTYRVLESCLNCENCFALKEYDSEDTYFCMHGSNDVPVNKDFFKRPPCGSNFLGESFDVKDEAKAQQQEDDWDEWARGRSVQPNAICSEYTQKC